MSVTATLSSRWYVLAVVAGQEPAVRNRIINRLERTGLMTPDLQFICPDEEVLVSGSGASRETRRRLTLPGYILVNARKLPAALVNNIKRVNGTMEFLGGDESPTALAPQEVAQMLGGGQGGAKARTARGPQWTVGQQVHITGGPLAEFSGAISEVDESRETAKVEVEIFGRATPAEVPFEHLRSV